MEVKNISFAFDEYDSIDQLNKADAQLLEEARTVTKAAYAPYSRFHVGAVAKLANGKTVTGTNQENASYPVGLCAERVLLSAASSLYPGVPIETIAISYHNTQGTSDRPISPCGVCRQSLVEYEMRLQTPIRLLLSGQEGKIISISHATHLLPLCFSGDDMK